MHITRQLLLSLSCLTAATCSPVHGCKAYPGTPDWPSSQIWSNLNKSLGGRLIAPTPPAAACHVDQPGHNETECITVQKGWTSYDWHTRDPVSVMWDNWSNDTCLPNSEEACSVRGYPAYVVNASTAEHVKVGVDFARKHSIRLVVKSTGHDFLGRSIAPGSLSIWVKHLNQVTYHTREFKLSGPGKVIPGDAMTAGGGTEMYDLYTAAAKHSQTIVGGGAKSVGISGYISGGGHSILSPRYGLAADQVLEMEVVTPQGKILKVNEDQNRDLFWALRGGGGSTFGVITSITLKTVPSPKIHSITWMILVKPNSTDYSDIISYTLSQVPSLMEAGLSGYHYIAYRTPNPIPDPNLPTTVDGFVGLAIVQDMTAKEVDDLFNPLNETLAKKWPGKASMYKIVTPYDSFLAWYDVNYDQGKTGGNSYLVSRLLDKHTLENITPQSTKAFMAPIPITGGYSIFMVGGKGVIDAEPRGGGNAVNPAWRNAYVHSLSALGFPHFNNTARLKAISALKKAFQPLRDLTPKSGAYINEALPFEKDFQKTFWGSNYERLLKIKRKLDPTDVFWCSPCVGNERWQVKENGQLCRVA